MVEVSDEKRVRRIKIHSWIAIVAGSIAVLSMALQYLVFLPLGIGQTESFGLGMYILTQGPFALIAAVMGFVAFFYGLKNPTWRGGRIALLTVGVLLFIEFDAPLLLGLIVSVAPRPA